MDRRVSGAMLAFGTSTLLSGTVVLAKKCCRRRLSLGSLRKLDLSTSRYVGDFFLGIQKGMELLTTCCLYCNLTYTERKSLAADITLEVTARTQI
jgi:hypothetical protein